MLYVALTRAKEKLILTGTLKDAPEKLEFSGSRRIFRKQQTDRFPTLQEKGLPVIWTGYFRQCFPMGTNTRWIVEAAELVLDEVENQLEQNEDLTERIGEIKAAPTAGRAVEAAVFAALSISG